MHNSHNVYQNITVCRISYGYGNSKLVIAVLRCIVATNMTRTMSQIAHVIKLILKGVVDFIVKVLTLS